MYPYPQQPPPSYPYPQPYQPYPQQPPLQQGVKRAPISKRNIAMIYILTIVTFGIYGIIWLYYVHKDIQALGGELPSFILALIPIASIYYLYRLALEFAKVVGEEDKGLTYFLIFMLVSIAMPFIVQSKLNKLAEA